MARIGLVGYGSMAEMIALRLLRDQQITERDLFIDTRTRGERLQALLSEYPSVHVDSLEEWAETCSLIFICVPPLYVLETKQRLDSFINEKTHIVSIAAGVPLQALEEGSDTAVSRYIPALTSEVKAGVSLIVHGGTVSSAQKNHLNERLSAFGTVREIEEDNLDAASNLTSSAPGLIAALFEEFALSAVKNSHLSKEEAFEFLVHSLYGTGKLLLEKQITFQETLTRVATKGGITGEGADVIRSAAPAMFDEVFEKTLEKYRNLSENVKSRM
ncbi:pyrroline-5-carboxylate reductase ProG [Bacillus nakamurai]|uniref:pyrroline-5-carboxylate reductase ProG n=1 Tax=Bacillus nakamurai TaxID=1793963 RepID=UPI0020C2FBF6|nr:pyrroline-5-carboxylate reductase ProG [Bacillus nakamurai]MCP6682792.1 pyrroline-5-carboxylate reductase ProG [Bacillus nakamurai]